MTNPLTCDSTWLYYSLTILSNLVEYVASRAKADTRRDPVLRALQEALYLIQCEIRAREEAKNESLKDVTPF